MFMPDPDPLDFKGVFKSNLDSLLPVAQFQSLNLLQAHGTSFHGIGFIKRFRKGRLERDQIGCLGH